jgi:F0F1-type ATP synthase assembly protein I
MKADPGKNLKDYARYSGLAIQMLVIILAGVWGGLKLDAWLKLKPLFTIALTIISVVMAIYFAIKDLLRK